MHIHHVSVSDEIEALVSAKIESGQYENVSELVRAALFALLREERNSGGVGPPSGNASSRYAAAMVSPP